MSQSGNVIAGLIQQVPETHYDAQDKHGQGPVEEEIKCPLIADLGEVLGLDLPDSSDRFGFHTELAKSPDPGIDRPKHDEEDERQGQESPKEALH